MAVEGGIGSDQLSLERLWGYKMYKIIYIF